MLSLIKIFDLRMPGQKQYSALNLLECSYGAEGSHGQGQHEPSTNNPESSSGQCCRLHRSVKELSSQDWNVFMRRSRRPRESSPVYSLSRPSSVSPTFYAGMEGFITQIDLLSVLDRHPDKIHEATFYRRDGHPMHLEDSNSMPMSTSRSSPLSRRPPPPDSSSSQIANHTQYRPSHPQSHSFPHHPTSATTTSDFEETAHSFHLQRLHLSDTDALNFCMYDQNLTGGQQRMREQCNLSRTRPAQISRPLSKSPGERATLTPVEEVGYLFDERWHWR